MEFSYKICRSCGNKFEGDLDICSVCNTEFQKIHIELKSNEHSKFLKFCKYCGRPFISGSTINRNGKTFFQSSKKSIYCKSKHYCQCQNCGNEIEVSLSSGWPNKVGCSRKCTSEIQHKTYVQTNLERYGVENPNQSEKILQKRKQTCLERYGVESVLCKGPVRDEINQSMCEKYGVECNISQNKDIRNKITQTVTEKYGGYTWQSPILSDKCKQTNLDRYGSIYPHQTENVKKKISDGLYMRHADTISDPIKRQNYLDFIDDPVNYIKNHFDGKPTIHEVSESLDNFDESTIYTYIGEGKSKLLFSYVYSKMEDELHEFIRFLGVYDFVPNCRTVISPKEIDIYIPNMLFGIECNPTDSHNSSIPFIDKSCIAVPSDYHKMKTDLCYDKDVFLMHIFGYEWTWKKDIIKSMIRNILGKCENRLYARNLYVEEIPYFECKSFLDHNHRQGYTNASVRLGLRDSNNQLVSVMTFDKTRKMIGRISSDTSYTWELSRFCSLLNTSVIGGASKLFKHFVRNYKYDKIISFSDRAHTRGTVYEKLGFHEVSISDPNYVWVRTSDNIYYNRVSCQKRNLPKLLNDPNLDIENQTEKQIMVTHGYVQVFDSGNIRWEYTK